MSILSVDIGGTFIKYALMSRNADILSRGKIATPNTFPPEKCPISYPTPGRGLLMIMSGEI